MGSRPPAPLPVRAQGPHHRVIIMKGDPDTCSEAALLPSIRGYPSFLWFGSCLSS